MDRLKNIRLSCPGCEYNWTTKLIPEPGNPGGFIAKESNCPVCGKQGIEKQQDELEEFAVRGGSSEGFM